jgi:putative hemolysin
MEIFLLFVLILVNGIFAMSEIALVTARRGRLQKLAEDGVHGASAAVKLAEEPTRFLSTIQIGITSIGILNGIVGEAVLARPLAVWLQGLGLNEDRAHFGATALAVLIITYFTIVVGELVPKRIGQMRPETIARFVAPTMQLLGIVTKPFGKLLTLSTEVVLGLMRLRGMQSNVVTEEEIHSLLEEGSDAGVIDPHEHEMARNVFRLDDRAVVSLMIPRLDLIYLDVDDPIDVNLKKIQESDHSRFPVVADGWEDILGMASAKLLLGQMLRGEPIDLRANLVPAVFVPETMNGTDLLASFRTSSVHSAIVVDEYGDVQGMVTVHDLIEAITGEFHTSDRADSWAVRRDDGSWLLDGLLAVPELKDVLELKAVVEEERGRYHTLAGMLMHLLGRVPVETDHVEWEKWRFEIIDMDGQRIDKVLASPLAVQEVDD